MSHVRRMVVIAASLAALTTGRAQGGEIAVGRYEGKAYNTTARREGTAVLEIVTVRAGKVYAHFQASQGLSGEGWLSGVAAGGTFTVEGRLSGWSMTLRARALPDGKISGSYELSGPGTQKGTIDVERRGPPSPVVADGEPPLTEEMVAHYLDLYDGLLELRLGADGRRELTAVLAAAWGRNDRVVIDDVLEDLVNTSGKNVEALKVDLGPDVQLRLIEAARRSAPRNAIEAALVAAFDRAHPDRVAATRGWGFADLVGAWRGGDALAPQRDVTGGYYGVSFSEADVLEISANHAFQRAYFREHCQWGGAARCCTQQRLGWRGTIDVEDGLLAFHIEGGLELRSEGCPPNQSVRRDIPAHVERARWSIRPRRQGTPALCWHDTPEHSICYVKQ